MRILLIVFIIMLEVCIISAYLFLFSVNKKQEHFIEIMKKKKTWRVITVIVIAPFILYAVVTMLLIIIRGDCFPAYHVYVDEGHYICYEDTYYVSITDDEEKVEMAEDYVQGNWIEKGYVRWEKTQFPYLHYWIPGYFLEELTTSQDGEYLYTHAWGGSTTFHEVYQRIEE